MLAISAWNYIKKMQLIPYPINPLCLTVEIQFVI